MAGLRADAAKPRPAPPADGPAAGEAKAAWDELEVEDHVASYCEAYEQSSKAKARAKSGAADGEADSDSDGIMAPEEGDAEDEQDRRRKPIVPLPPVDHAAIEYAPVRTAFYTPHPDIEKLSEEEVAAVRSDMRIAATGSNCPSPAVSFAHLGLPQELMQGIRKHGYVKPTPIQCQSIPAGLSGRDV